MDIAQLTQEFTDLIRTDPGNFVAPEDAIRPELSGLRLYDDPLLAVGAADDPLFAQLRQSQILHPQALLPTDFLPNCRSVISFFLPFTQEVRRSNRESRDQPSDQWLHARIEGQLRVATASQRLCDLLRQAGGEALSPANDPRCRELAPYTFSWSERHAAYICGLGTFGLSRGLITAKGMAGRFGSVLTSLELPPTPRDYSDRYQYCTRCGQCARNCPAQAIDPAQEPDAAKDHRVCGPFVAATQRPPQGASGRQRYGCGKCQVSVPCENRIPGRKQQAEVRG